MGNPTAVRPSSAFTTVDLDREGKQVGFLMIPHSPNDDAWGATRVPLAVIKNGSGPTVVLEGGNHGDEYEGPITICELIRELDPGRVQGRLILMPANNVHAVMAGQRVSPVDGLNFNRTFPGDTRGTITM
jgi:N2-acetyl-L-2,4-diaminobutanoate deacetylase